MTVRQRIIANLYKDSVALMAVSSKLLALDGIDGASVVMATPTNLDNLVQAGLGDVLEAKASDLVVAVSGADAACAAAIELAEALLTEAPVVGGGEVAESPASSIQLAVDRDPAVNFALVSVPGPYAAAEAIKALRLGMSVMVFSDNVPVEQELAMKRLADERGLLVMGPDCGTAIVNGLPLGFANVVRRGPIGVVGASGTGTQEVTARIHNLGSGVSQALGTGGHDLSDHIGGISMLRGLTWLEDDPQTEVIVLVSKPPSRSVASVVLERARAMTTPVVVVFLGADPAGFSDERIVGAATLADAADLAVAIATGATPPDLSGSLTGEQQAALDAATARLTPEQRDVRGVFCGGTFCFEAQLLLQAAGITSSSNTPVTGNRALVDIRVSEEHTVVDMGDDEFTQGRPHPMIDPTLRDERVARDLADPTTAVLLVDVVLGYGSADDPLSGLIAVLDATASSAVVVAHVCGTDADPQDRDAAITRLRAAGALVASNNAEAARWAAYVATEVAG